MAAGFAPNIISSDAVVCRLCRHRHNRHHADVPIMPIDAGLHPLGSVTEQTPRVPAAFVLSA